MKSKFTKASMAVMAFLGVQSAFAQQDSVSVIDEVVITGAKTHRSAGNITQKIDVIKLGEIESVVLGNQNIGEVVARKPGAAVSALSRNDANWGTYAGIGPKYSTYMLDGLPIDAFVDPISLDLKAVSRLEVQRGPASVLYPNYLSQDFAGNQSPLAGTINLILKKDVERRETSILGSYGSYNTYNGQIYHQDKIGGINFFGGLNYESSDYMDYGIKDSWLNMKKDPEYTKFKAFLGANYTYGQEKKNRVSLFFHRMNHKGDAGRVYRGYEHHYTTMNVSNILAISDVLHFNTSAGVRVYDRNWQESNFDVINNIDVLASNNGAYQRIIPVDANITFKHLERHLLTIGVDYQNATYHNYEDALRGYKTYGTKSRANQKGIYIQEELVFGGLSLRGGLRYNYITTKIDLIGGASAGEPKVGQGKLLWSVGAKYNTGQYAVFANAGNSFMTPGLKSLGGTIKTGSTANGQLPNPDLKPESGLGLDVGAEAKLLDNQLKLGARAFFLSIKDAITDVVVSSVPSQSKSINAGDETHSNGFELEVNHNLNDQLSWFANYTYMKPKIKGKENSTVAFAPNHIFNAGISYQSDFGLKINPILSYGSDYYDSNSTTGKAFKQGTVINLFVSQKLINKENKDLDVFVKIYNLTDNRYEMPWQFRNTGFAITGGFVINFR